MTKKFIVGFINFFENKLVVELVEAENWKDALARHSELLDENGNPDDNSWLPDDIEEAKQEGYNADFLFDVKEI